MLAASLKTIRCAFFSSTFGNWEFAVKHDRQ